MVIHIFVDFVDRFVDNVRITFYKNMETLMHSPFICAHSYPHKIRQRNFFDGRI